MEPYSTRGNREQLQPHEKETPNAESGPPSDHSVVQTTVSAEFHLFPTNLLVVMQADKLRMLELLTAYKLNVTGHGGFAKVSMHTTTCTVISSYNRPSLSSVLSL